MDVISQRLEDTNELMASYSFVHLLSCLQTRTFITIIIHNCKFIIYMYINIKECFAPQSLLGLVSIWLWLSSFGWYLSLSILLFNCSESLDFERFF